MLRRSEGEEEAAGRPLRLAINAPINQELLTARPELRDRAVLERLVNPGLTAAIAARMPGATLTLPNRPGPAPAPVPVPVPVAPPVIPAAPAANPFTELPYPSPGDRIKADDFKKLSQSLMIIADMAMLSAQLFGRTLAEARTALTGKGYTIARVMSVFGGEPGGPTDASFDGRRVLQVLPAVLGESSLLVLVSEAVETRRFAPNFTAGGVSYTYRQAVETMRSVLGEAGMTGLPMDAPNLMQKTLTQAAQEIAARR